MTDYESGFCAGETAAWEGRGKPLPIRPAILNERMRGYWDGRIPRSLNWTQQRPAQGARWDAAMQTYMVARS